MSYQLAVEKILQHEGGFVDHPADRGGATNFGITQAVYEAFKGRKVTVGEMRLMPRSDAYEIYKAKYWDTIGGDQIRFYSVAFAIFDQAVNRGVSAALKQAQRVAGVPADGKVGPKTIAAINAMGETDFISKYVAQSLAAYEAIVARDPSQAVFIKGWRNRVQSLADYAAKNLGAINSGAAISIASLLLVGVIFFLIFNNAKAKA